jgi:carbamoyl-phosphate synthase large subunit
MDKTETFAAAARDLVAMGFQIVATKGTAQVAGRAGVPPSPSPRSMRAARTSSTG